MSSTAIVIRAGRGGRPLLQTADSVLRSGKAPARTLITLSTPDSAPLVDAVTGRLDAAIVDTPHDPLSSAIRAIDATYVLFLHAGYMLDELFLERCEAAFEQDPSVAAIVPPVRLQTADATAYLEWRPAATTPVSVLNDTRSVPAVFAIRRDLWEALGGFDAAFDELAEYEFWLRLTLAGHKVGVLDEALVARDITVAPDHRRSGRNDGRPAGQSQDPRLRRFRAVLEKHAAAIEKVMREVVVAREVRFGQLREVHRDLTTRRDAGLAELGRLRAEAAHLRAYLTHHARAGIDWGDLRHTDPISRDWGYDRGVPIDRRYIDDFVAAHSSDVRGSVLEVQEPEYTRACGGPRVTASSVLDIDAANPRATVVADLRNARNIAAEQFDCIILTQTLHVIDDMGAALRECHRILKPGGVLLATLPAASRVCLEYGRDGDLWRMTPAGARLLFRSAFAPSTVTTSEYGNVLTNVAFLHGAATAELSDAEFDTRDPYFVALTGVRAKKGSSPSRRGARGLVLLYHRIEENWDVHDLAIPPTLFEAQLAWLRREYNVLPLADLLSMPPESLPERAIALTFDDGYVDSLTTVAPLLEKYDLPATFLLTTRWRRERGEYWWDLLERVMLSTPGVPPSFALETGSLIDTLPTGTNEERMLAHARLHDVMVHATLEERDALVSRLGSWGGRVEPRVRPMLDGEVRQLAACPKVAIGAHSVNHLMLPDQNPDVVRREILDSCEALTELTGKPVDVFAYPYGGYDRVAANAVRRLCRWGLSCDQRVIGESFDAATVPRLEVKRWDWLEFASRLEPLFHPRRGAVRRAFMP